MIFFVSPYFPARNCSCRMRGGSVRGTPLHVAAIKADLNLSKNLEVRLRIKSTSLKPDVLLLDLTMPKKDGLTALKEIKETDPNAKIIMLSAADSKKMVDDCLAAGASTFIPKPFDFNVVLEKIKNI